MLSKYEVPADKLRWECDPNLFHFECTGDLAPLREFIGQERATRAVEFGLNMINSGYNIYVAGLTGTGKTSMVKSYIEKVIKQRKESGDAFVLEDWCYIYNFKEPDSPKITAEKKTPFDFTEHVSEIWVALDNNRGTLSFTVINEDIDLKWQKRVPSTHDLTDRNSE